MKRVFALLLAAVMLLSLAACDQGSPAPSNPTASGSGESTAPAEENELSFTFTRFGKAKVVICGAEFKKDEYGEDYLRVYYDYINMDETAAGHEPYLSVELEATQNGEALDDDEFSADDADFVPEDAFMNCAVQPGIPMRCTMIVYCNPDNGPVDFALRVMVGSWAYNEEALEWFRFRIDPKNLMPVPARAAIQPIPEPTYAKDLPASGTSTTGSNPFTISLNGYELTTYDGQPALRVKMTYTHQHEWEMTPYTALPIFAFQDGISLEQADTWYLDDVKPEDEAYEADVTTGQTVECNAIFLLRSKSPVEVVVEQPLDDLRAGMICSVA